MPERSYPQPTRPGPAEFLMEPSSRTPEGEPNRCPVCGKELQIEPSRPPGDAPCPHCGHLLWFSPFARSRKFRNLADDVIKREDLPPWLAEKLMRGKHSDFRLGSYRILRPLQRGDLSGVFLAKHITTHRRCVIKVLPSKCQDDEDLLIRFHVAARAAVGLFHLNIALIYDVDKDLEHGIHYLVREYVCGSDLQSMVEKKGPFDYRMAADLIAQAAGGLAYAHAAGILHLDVSPSQLVADHRGVLKILDFGLSVLTTGVTDYLAPEQVVGSGRLDGRADIYGLGHTFYFSVDRPSTLSKANPAGSADGTSDRRTLRQ